MRIKSESQHKLAAAYRSVRDTENVLANVQEQQSIFLAVNAEYFDESIDVDDDVFDTIVDDDVFDTIKEIVLKNLKERVKRAKKNLDRVLNKQKEL